MKRFRTLAALLCILAMLVPGELALAAPSAKLFLDGQPLASDVAPTIVNNRTLVPLRVIMESLGANVHWQSNSEPIVIRKNNMEIQIQVGKAQASVNGQVVNLDVSPVIVQNRAMVPLRFIGESLGAGIWWDPATRSVYITSPTGQLGAGEFRREQGVVTGLSFKATRPLELSPLEIDADGREATLIVQNAVAEAASEQLTGGDILGFSVQPIDDSRTRIHLQFGDRFPYLSPQATLSSDQLTLNLTWPLALKEVSFQQSGGVEQLTFPLPENMKPEIKDATIEVERRGSLPGRIIVTDGANVRANPSTESDRIGLIPYRGTVEVIGVIAGWYEVRLNGDTGWIADWLVAVETSVETQVGVRVRSTPSTANDSNILTTLYPGHKISVLERIEGWCYVEYAAGKEGYIADYLVPLESRLINADIVPGITINFPGVSKGSKTEFSLAGSSHFAAANWKEDSNGTSLTLQLKQPVSHRLTYTDAGWQLTFGTWIQKVEFASTDRGPRLRLTLDGPSAPTVRYSSAEEAVILTVGGATLAKDVPATISGDGAYVSQIKAEQVGSEVRLSVMQPRALAYHLQKISETTWELVITSPTLVNKIIAIDPGHGAVDIGAPGTLGWHEADYTHDIAYRLRDLLTQAGAKVVMTRLYESGPIQGPARAAKINASGADLFFSIHINSATNRSARGIETWFYPRGDNERFARLVQNSVLAELGGDWPNRGIKTSYNFIICRDTLTTGVMAELGFISNATDEGLLYQASIRQRIAQGLFNAAERYFAYE